MVVRLGHVERRACTCWKRHDLKQKRADVMLALDLVELCECGALSIALVAGDSDFVPAVQVVKAMGAQVHLYQGTGNHRAHQDLARACASVTSIDAAFARMIVREEKPPVAA